MTDNNNPEGEIHCEWKQLIKVLLSIRERSAGGAGWRVGDKVASRGGRGEKGGGGMGVVKSLGSGMTIIVTMATLLVVLLGMTATCVEGARVGISEGNLGTGWRRTTGNVGNQEGRIIRILGTTPRFPPSTTTTTTPTTTTTKHRRYPPSSGGVDVENDSWFASSSSSSSSEGGSSSGADRVQKVKAKWKGDKFWAESVANLTLLESRKTSVFLNNSEPSPPSKTPPPDVAMSSSSRKMASSQPPTQSTTYFDPADSKFRASPTITAADESGDESTPDLSPSSNYTVVIPPKKKIISERTKSHKNKKKNKPRPPNPATNFNLPPTKSPGREVPRTTLTADLSVYGQNYVLEYESDEAEGQTKGQEEEEQQQQPVEEHEEEREHVEETNSIEVVPSTTPKVKQIVDSLRRQQRPHHHHHQQQHHHHHQGKSKSKDKKASKVKGSKVKTRQKSKYGSTFGFPRPASTATTTTKDSAATTASSTTLSYDSDQRTTLVADLTPYGQEAYLEYDSDEGGSSGSGETRNASTILNTTIASLFGEFYPKNPTNLLNVLQALASNMQPIKMHSPLGGEAPSIPLRYNVNFTNRVPMKVNPPTSPFLFSLDLDSFFTRMAISVFYSTVAIAPLVYIMMGGIGGLGGLSALPLLPFTGKKRRRRRRSTLSRSPNDPDNDDNYDFYSEQEIHQLELVMHRFWKFLANFEPQQQAQKVSKKRRRISKI